MQLLSSVISRYICFHCIVLTCVPTPVTFDQIHFDTWLFLITLYFSKMLFYYYQTCQWGVLLSLWHFWRHHCNVIKIFVLLCYFFDIFENVILFDKTSKVYISMMFVYAFHIFKKMRCLRYLYDVFDTKSYFKVSKTLLQCLQIQYKYKTFILTRRQKSW